MQRRLRHNIPAAGKAGSALLFAIAYVTGPAYETISTTTGCFRNSGRRP